MVGVVMCGSLSVVIGLLVLSCLQKHLTIDLSTVNRYQGMA
jgi:hypothetical protein